METSTDVPTPSVEEQVTDAPIVTEDVTKSGEQDVTEEPSQSIPLSRFQEVNNAKKEAEDRAAKAEARAAELEAKHQETEDEDLNPEAEKLIGAYVKKHGLMSREELQAQQQKVDEARQMEVATRQVKADIEALTAQYASTSIPYDDKAVVQFAEKHNIALTSRASKEAVYRQMNFDKLVEAERLRAIDSYKKNPGSLEKPGSTRGDLPKGDSTSMTPQERREARFAAAREKLGLAIK